MQLIKSLVSNNQIELIAFENQLTVASAMEGVSLAKLSKSIESINVMKAISYLTLRLASNFNVGKNITNDQSAIIASDLLEIFKYETLEDVVLMFKYARQGKIGDGKDFKIDSQTIFHKWIPQYLEMKSIERENSHTKFKGENNINNFKWQPEDVSKFVTSEKTETITTKPTGLGERSKKNFATKDEYVSPISPRDQYLTVLAIEARKASVTELKHTLEYYKEKQQPDVIEVIEKELTNRQ